MTNKYFWLLMVKVELSDRLKLIKHQMRIMISAQKVLF